MNKDLQKKELAKVYYLPKADLLETNQGYRILVDLPGVAKEDLSVSLEQNRLSIEGKVTPRGNSHKLKEEYAQGHFKRNFRLSEAIDKKALIAQLEDGVLTVELQRQPEAKPLQIKVS